MLKNIYNQKITILNKLKRTDSATGMDVWYKHTVDDAVWYTDAARTATNSSVFIGTYVTVLIPFHNEFLPYLKWRENNMHDHYTVSAGDYIILGEVPEEINASNVVKIMEKYGSNACQVKHHRTTHKRFGANIQLKIEGV